MNLILTAILIANFVAGIHVHRVHEDPEDPQKDTRVARDNQNLHTAASNSVAYTPPVFNYQMAMRQQDLRKNRYEQQQRSDYRNILTKNNKNATNLRRSSSSNALKRRQQSYALHRVRVTRSLQQKSANSERRQDFRQNSVVAPSYGGNLPNLRALSALLGQNPRLQLEGLRKLLQNNHKDHTPIEEDVDDVPNPQSKPNIRVENVDSDEGRFDTLKFVPVDLHQAGYKGRGLNYYGAQLENDGNGKYEVSDFEDDYDHGPDSAESNNATLENFDALIPEALRFRKRKPDRNRHRKPVHPHHHHHHHHYNQHHQHRHKHTPPQKVPSHTYTIKNEPILHTTQYSTLSELQNAGQHTPQSPQIVINNSNSNNLHHHHYQHNVNDKVRPHFFHTDKTHNQYHKSTKPDLKKLFRIVHKVNTAVDKYALKYAFGYKIKDGKMGNDFGQEEKRDGRNVKGSYHVLLPDGRRQNVEYYADPSGYHARVTYDTIAHHFP